MVSWQLSAKFPLFFVKSFMGRETLFSPSMAWELEGLASSGVVSATDCQFVNPRAVLKCPHPDQCWMGNEDQSLPGTYQCLLPNDHNALLCSAETWDPYNICSGKWIALTLWPEGVPSGVCSHCCAALLRDRRLSRTDEPSRVGTHIPLQCFREKRLSLGYFQSLRRIYLSQGEVWNRLINVNYLITKMIFRRNVKAQRFRNNKLEKWSSYAKLYKTLSLHPKEVENVKILNPFHRNYLEKINNVLK